MSVGDFVSILPVPPATEVRKGICRFVGETEFAEGLWIGVELVGSVGKNSGSVYDKQYFQCLPQQGVFVRPELVRPYPSAASESESSKPSEPPTQHFDLQLHVEIESLKEQLSAASRSLEEKTASVEGLQLDLEIAQEQLLIAETEIEELRVSGGGTAGSDKADMAQALIAARRQVSLLEKECASLKDEKAVLEEQIKATESSDQIIESITTRNLELDEEVTRVKSLLESLLKQRDDMQEVLSLQDEELRLQKEQNQELAHALEVVEDDRTKERDAHNTVAADLYKKVSHLESQLFDISQTSNARAETHSNASLINTFFLVELQSIVGSIAAVDSNPSSLCCTDGGASFHESLLSSSSSLPCVSPADIAGAWMVETSRSLDQLAASFESSAATLLIALNRMMADKDVIVALDGSSDASAGQQWPVDHLRNECVTLHSSALVFDLIRVEFVAMRMRLDTWSLLDQANTTPAVCSDVEWRRQITTVVSKCLTVSKDLIHYVCFSIPHSSSKIHDLIRKLLQLVQKLRSSLDLAQDSTSSCIGPVPSGEFLRVWRANVDLIFTQWKPRSQDKNCAEVLNLAENFQHAILGSCSVDLKELDSLAAMHLIMHVAFTCGLYSCIQTNQLLDVCRDAWLTAYPKRDGNAAASETSSVVQSLLLAMWFDGLGGTLSLFGNRKSTQGKLLVGLSQLVGGDAIIASHLIETIDQEQFNVSDWHTLVAWSSSSLMQSVKELLLLPANSNNNATSSVVQNRTLTTIIVKMLHNVSYRFDEVSNAEKNRKIENDAAGSADGKALEVLERLVTDLQLENATLKSDVEQARWAQWQATSENEALAMVKADFQRIQHSLEEQETAHQTRLRTVSHEYDAAIAMMQQKTLQLSQELQLAKRQELQKELSPMSLRERREFLDSVSTLQHHLTVAYGATLRPLPVSESSQSTRLTSPISAVALQQSLSQPLPTVLRFTGKAERQRSREQVFIPKSVRHP